jgi:putative transposase
MARIARVVAPGIPHHIVQRGNRRQETFFRKEDYQAYLTFMAYWCRDCGVEIWAYCLMPNHVHLIAVPESEDGLRRAIGEAHKKYSLRINLREGWQGHLWQGRFRSYAMDEAYLLVATRYVEMNPVHAGMVKRPEDYPWSSALAHIHGEDDLLVKTRPLLEMAGEWRSFLSGPVSDQDLQILRKHETTGRPLGDSGFISRLEKTLEREVRPKKRGRKRKGDPK